MVASSTVATATRGTSRAVGRRLRGAEVIVDSRFEVVGHGTLDVFVPDA
jgi:hypothetical protein